MYYVTTFSLFFVFRESLAPFWIEWLLLIWISGLLLGELISPQDKSGLGMIKIVVIVLNLVSHHSLESPPPSFFVTKEKRSGGTVDWPYMLRLGESSLNRVKIVFMGI